MPRNRSAAKRLRQSQKRRLRNKIRKSVMRTHVRKLQTAVAHRDLAAARNLLPAVYGTIDKAASSGTIHKNQAARRKSRLTRMVNRLEASEE